MTKKEKTIEQKRIEILKDVLKHIEAKRIKAKNLVVLAYGKVKEMEKGDLQSILKKYARRKKPCQTCQRGALLFASVWRDNNLEILRWSSNNEFPNCLLGVATDRQEDASAHGDYLNKLFPVHQQRLMERAFEGRFHEVYLTFSETFACDRFVLKYKNPTTRMKNIVKNAIKNEGIFKP